MKQNILISGKHRIGLSVGEVMDATKIIASALKADGVSAYIDANYEGEHWSIFMCWGDEES